LLASFQKKPFDFYINDHLMKSKIDMSIWGLVFSHAEEELQALRLRKQANPQVSSIDAQIKEAQSRLEQAKSHLTGK
jgi:hypothetical protein